LCSRCDGRGDMGVEVTVGDGPNNSLVQKSSSGHSTLVVVLAFVVGALAAALPLGIIVGSAEKEIEIEHQPEWDWSFEGACSDFNASHMGPRGFDPNAFSFEFIVPAPHRGIMMTNTARPHTPSAKDVGVDEFFQHLTDTGFNAILRVHKEVGAVAVQLPFTTTAAASACTSYPPGWEHTMSWSCATIKGDALWGKEHKFIAAEPLKSMNCSLFVDLHTPY